MFPVLHTVKTLITGSRTQKWLLASAAAVAMAAPGIAQAGRNDRDGRESQRDVRPQEVHREEAEHREVDRPEAEHHDEDRHEADYRHDERHDDGFLGLRLSGDLRFGDRDDRPVYRTVTDQRWVEPVYQTVTEQVWVPDAYEDRPVQYVDRGRVFTRIDHVLVAPGHYETRTRQVCVTEGRWETFERQVLVGD